MEVTTKIIALGRPGARSVMIERSQYVEVFHFIISTFDSRNEISFPELVDLASKFTFEAAKSDPMWFLLKVKQDLQTRGILRIKFMGASPPVQMLRINRLALDRQRKHLFD
jgi:hypothetical protein